ncbi:MAG: hypothetical protein JST17_00615 [Bacteroidetes bacterium]|nr:hypothetical protein [Bacteroidota bacterium]MBS1931787.1 hypothetical protein [Bacteroidota bacterium]
MTLIVKKNSWKNVVRAFPDRIDIDFSKVELDESPYLTRKTKSTGKKEIPDNLQKSVDFVNKYKKGKAKAKPPKQLLNEL